MNCPSGTLGEILVDASLMEASRSTAPVPPSSAAATRSRSLPNLTIRSQFTPPERATCEPTPPWPPSNLLISGRSNIRTGTVADPFLCYISMSYNNISSDEFVGNRGFSKVPQGGGVRGDPDLEQGGNIKLVVRRAPRHEGHGSFATSIVVRLPRVRPPLPADGPQPSWPAPVQEPPPARHHRAQHHRRCWRLGARPATRSSLAGWRRTAARTGC